MIIVAICLRGGRNSFVVSEKQCDRVRRSLRGNKLVVNENDLARSIRDRVRRSLTGNEGLIENCVSVRSHVNRWFG